MHPPRPRLDRGDQRARAAAARRTAASGASGLLSGRGGEPGGCPSPGAHRPRSPRASAADRRARGFSATWISPLFTFLAVPVAALFGPDLLAGRLLAALAGALAIPAGYGLARAAAADRGGAAGGAGLCDLALANPAHARRHAACPAAAVLDGLPLGRCVVCAARRPALGALAGAGRRPERLRLPDHEAGRAAAAGAGHAAGAAAPWLARPARLAGCCGIAGAALAAVRQRDAAEPRQRHARAEQAAARRHAGRMAGAVGAGLRHLLSAGVLLPDRRPVERHARRGGAAAGRGAAGAAGAGAAAVALFEEMGGVEVGSGSGSAIPATQNSELKTQHSTGG